MSDSPSASPAFCQARRASFAPGVPAAAVDATGAGDAFWGGFLYRLLRQGYPMAAQSAEMLADCLAFGNRVGAYCVGHLGAISGMPTMAQLETMR